MRRPVNICGPTQEARSSRSNDQVTINMYARQSGQGAKSPFVMYSLPGLRLLQTVGLGPHRCKPIKFGASWFTVSRDAFYEVDGNGIATQRGTLNTSTGRCKLVKNFSTQILVVDGTDGYIWNGSTFTVIADTDFPARPIDADYINGYFQVVDGDTNNWYISALNDGTSWGAADYGVAQARADYLLAINSSTGDVWLVGEESLEIWWHSGNSDFPFQLIPGMIFDYGIIAPRSLDFVDANPIWLANAPTGGNIVVGALNRQPRVLSDDDLNWQLAQLTRTDDAIGLTYMQAGVPFYVLTFPTDGVTFGLDVQTGGWHRREAPDGGAWNVAGIVFYDNQHIAVSSVDGSIYALEFDTYTDNDENRRRLRRTGIVDDGGNKLTHNSFELICDVGVGTLSGDGVTPVVMMRYSDDGTKTWSSDVPRPLGVQGAYRNRLVWEQLGDSYGRVYEVRCDHPVDFTIIEAWVDVTKTT